MCWVQSTLFKDVDQRFGSLTQEVIFKDLVSFQIQSSVDLDFKDKMVKKFLNLRSMARYDQYKLNQYKFQQSILDLQILFVWGFITIASIPFRLFHKLWMLDSGVFDQSLREFWQFRVKS